MKWQDELRKSIRTAEQLAPILNLSSEEEAACAKVIEKYPMMITPYYFSLIDPKDPNDPIARMCIPSFQEFDDGGSPDTSGEETNTKQDGLQHKYKETVLLLSTNRCAMYCRHCFRKRMVGLSKEALNQRVDEAVAYIRAHPEVNNVLISGGDAFLNTNDIIERYLKEMTSLPQLNYIRFGTRVPITLPERIYDDPEFLQIFSAYAKKKSIYIVTQFNHPREITEDSIRALQCMMERGVQIRNQTVLLKGVNDDPDVLAALLSHLTQIGVVPYYLFQCRPVTGVKGQFQIPIQEGIRIVDQAKSMQNGFGKAVRFALSHPEGKIEILGMDEDGYTLFKFHQSKLPENQCRIFRRKLTEEDTWLDDSLNGCTG
ncbi:MAG: KamA family radical SAM protein [Clostridiales bacterium]|nr:KamA family radical SAM protein [Clostridiales bacterium]